MMIDLSLVDYNPYRDLELDPIDSERVASLASSIGSDLGFWGGIAVRKVEGRYQLAFGHHRFEALKFLGWPEADLNVAEFDDRQMVRAMHSENALQRKGLMNVVEAVGAAIRVLGPALLRGELGKILPSLGHNSEEVSRTLLLKGGGIGKDTLQAFFQEEGKDLSEGDIRAAIAYLKDTGKMRDYLNGMVEALPEALKGDARKAAGKASGRIVDPAVIQLFGANTSQAQATRRILRSESGQSWIPPEEQFEVVKAIRDKIGERGHEVTADGMKLWLNSYRGHLARLLCQMEESATSPERQKADEITRNFNALTAGVGRVTSAATFLQGKAEAGEPLPLSKDDFHGFFKNDVRLMNESIAALAQALRVDEVESIVSIQ